MAVCRIEKTKDYTVMANHHLRNKRLSLKAKGLLSLMLSLPENWDYTIKGLSFICKDGIDSINGAIKELEQTGYVKRQRIRNEKGQLTDIEYTIREYPKVDEPKCDPPIVEVPITENPIQAIPTQENHAQLNTYPTITDKSNIDLLNTHSIPIHSLNPLPYEYEEETPKEWKRTDRNEAYKVYEEIIKDNIEYEHFVTNKIIMQDKLDEIVDIILETVCTARKTIRIAGDDYPAELVKSKFMKLNSSHIEFVMNCMSENTTKVRNIKQYLKAVLFNAPSTMDSYYSALVNHDLYGDR